MMKLLDGLRKKKNVENTVSDLYKDAIASRMPMAMKVFEESLTGDNSKIPIILSENSFASMDKVPSRKFIDFITEKRVIAPASYKNMSIMKSPFNYDRIDAFYMKESYFSRSLVRQIETMLRNGFEYISDDKEFLNIMKMEMSRIHMDSGISTRQLVYGMTMSLLKYGIVIIHKVRETVKDDIAIDDKRRKRITKLRLISPHDVMFYVNQKGKIMGIQEIRYSLLSSFFQKTFGGGAGYGIPIEDLAIGYMYDPGDKMFPEPPCFQILDDILTLRSLEETIELLGFQFGSPLLHAKVGTDELPSNDVEVANVNARLGEMASNGMVTTDHRVSIDVINLQKGTIDLIPYVEYFKNRVLIGSGSSPMSVGEGNSANRNTAESLDNALADRCTYLSTVVSDMFNYNIIPDITVKSETPYEYKDIFNKMGDLKGYIEFNEPTLEKKIARENSVINLWEGNLMPLSQARKTLKLHPLTDEEKKELFVNIVSIPTKEAGPSAAEGETGSAAGGRARSANQPSNQHGVKAGPGSTKN
jgi:hypothetical protein